MVYSAAGNDIYAWRRGCELKHTYKGGLISKSNFNLVLKKLFDQCPRTDLSKSFFT